MSESPRDTFDRLRHFSQVLLQQGRVSLDADSNEQSSILLYLLRRLAADLIGSHGGPAEQAGFRVGLAATEGAPDLTLSPGRYYVDGILCENEAEVAVPLKKLHMPGTVLVFLDVWEREVGWIEDGGLSDSALGGPDTATRRKVVWQAKLEPVEGIRARADLTDKVWIELVERWQPRNRGRVTARLEPSDSCIASGYGGSENRLYRIEIHTGGNAGGMATFKWSRDNGAVAFRIRKLEGVTATLDGLGRDDRRTLETGDRVEIVNDESILLGQPRRLRRVRSVDRDAATVELDAGPEGLPTFEKDDTTRPHLRRWDQQAEKSSALAADGAFAVTENEWLVLDDGIEISFAPASPDEEPARYRTGDYWHIERRPTGEIEWPRDNREEVPQPPRGIDHHYAPLALIDGKKDPISANIVDVRKTFKPLAD